MKSGEKKRDYSVENSNASSSSFVGNTSTQVNYPMASARFPLSYSSQDYVHYNEVQHNMSSAWSTTNISQYLPPLTNANIGIDRNFLNSTQPGPTVNIAASKSKKNSRWSNSNNISMAIPQSDSNIGDIPSSIPSSSLSMQNMNFSQKEWQTNEVPDLSSQNRSSNLNARQSVLGSNVALPDNDSLSEKSSLQILAPNYASEFRSPQLASQKDLSTTSDIYSVFPNTLLSEDNKPLFATGVSRNEDVWGKTRAAMLSLQKNLHLKQTAEVPTIQTPSSTLLSSNSPVFMTQETPFLKIPEKKIVICGMILHPPNPTEKIPRHVAKPLGCKTVYVKGLSEILSMTKIRSLFGQWGHIDYVKPLKYQLCHVRFKDTTSVDVVVQLSGFYLEFRCRDKWETVKFQVDYVSCPKDLREFEKTCSHEKEKQNPGPKMQTEEWRSVPSAEWRSVPCNVQHIYKETELQKVIEDLKKDDTFKRALKYVVMLFEKGKCNKQNVSNFFSMLHSVSCHLKKLQDEKNQMELDLDAASEIMDREIEEVKDKHTDIVKEKKENLQKQTSKISIQLEEIWKIFELSLRKRIWDHFTKTQRKLLEVWKDEISSFKRIVSEELISERKEEEMDLDELEEDVSVSNTVTEICKTADQLHNKNSDSSISLNPAKPSRDLLQFRASWEAKMRGESIKSLPAASISEETTSSSSSHQSVGISTFTKEEVIQISLISAYLATQSYGASISSILSYLLRANTLVSFHSVDELMRRLPSIFKEEIPCGEVQTKWFFTGPQMDTHPL